MVERQGPVMDFIQFASVHGVIIERLDQGRWVRVRTTDKPSHKNGAYKWLGDVGFVQNWATMTEPSVWRAEGVDMAAQRAIVRQASLDDDRRNREAAERAKWILTQCELKPHAYLAVKGFPDELVNVWERDGLMLAVIPMRIGGAIVGCQIIDDAGDKKFLSGQKTSGSTFAIGQGVNVVCEGYATALSVRQALRSIKINACVHVCFSAGNMRKVAATLGRGLTIVDNDASNAGQDAAKAIGWPLWMPDAVGEDANDYHKRCGLFSLAMGLKVALQSMRA